MLSCFNASSSVNAVISNEPVSIHQRLMILSGDGEQTKMMKIKTPCNAIKTSKKANGDISFEAIAVFKRDVSISINIHIDITPKRNATLLALKRSNT